MSSINVSAARAELPELIDAVERGEEMTLTRHDRPVAVLVRPDRFRARRADDVFTEATGIRNLLESARNRPLSSGATSEPGSADESVAAVRAARDQR